MDTRILTAAYVGAIQVKAIYNGDLFIWPDPWDDIWDEGGSRGTWTDTGWHDVWRSTGG